MERQIFLCRRGPVENLAEAVNKPARAVESEAPLVSQENLFDGR